MLLVPVDPKAAKAAGFTFHSPTATKPFGRVEQIKGARIKVKTDHGRYVLEAAIPLKALHGIRPRPKTKLRGDVDFISSNATGNINTARTYWGNTVNDVFGEHSTPVCFLHYSVTARAWKGTTTDLF